MIKSFDAIIGYLPIVNFQYDFIIVAGIYLSSDFGRTWQASNQMANKEWCGVAMDASGGFIYATGNGYG